MIELPVCKWRGKMIDGQYSCSSPLLIVPSGMVASETCARCEVYNLGGTRSTVQSPKSTRSRRSKLWRFAGQAYSYLEAKARWIAAGCPRPTEKQLAEREAVCRGCSHYRLQQDGCGLCGCGVDGGSLDEKRRMATEECPDNPPRWRALA